MTVASSAQWPPATRARGMKEVVAATLAAFGLTWAAAVAAVVTAGALNWISLPPWLDYVLPLAVLGGGLLLAGRVAATVAPRRGTYAAVAAGTLVMGFGTMLSRAAQAHGGIAHHAMVAGLLVAVISGASALWTDHRRGHIEPGPNHANQPEKAAESDRSSPGVASQHLHNSAAR